MTGEILVRAYEEDKKFINSLKAFKTQQERLHVIVKKYREVTRT